MRNRLATGLTTAALLLGGASLAPQASAAEDDEIYWPITYDTVGTTHVGAGVDADASLGPATLRIELGLLRGGLRNGALPLPPTSIEFKALGVVPLRAKVSFHSASPITGQLDSGEVNTVTATASYYVQLSDVKVKVLGVWTPLYVGNRCQTADPVRMTLKTPEGTSFDLNTGGPIGGRYTIGKFANCAPLQLPDVFGIGSLAVNTLVPGSNNTATIHLSNLVFLP
ncbi:hypothetical protein [Pimelobacter simplex]|uniref:hypothetical protein n=1 Tax=Nocardioides simplex TaxID=2045 RepID=UPI003AACB902